MNAKQLKAAAERMARILDWANPGEVYGGQDYTQDYSADCATLCKWAVARLAADEAERAERDKPIDEEWLSTIAHDYETDDRNVSAWFDSTLNQLSVSRHRPRGLWQVSIMDDSGDDDEVLLPVATTRGQLLDLLRALGVELT
jgi:hypothetical protein